MADRRNSSRPAQAVPDLPPAGTRRWVARRKAQVVEAVLSGMLRLDEALRRYELSIEEFSLWKRRFYRSGVDGLRMSPRLRHD
jgi:transposase